MQRLSVRSILRVAGIDAQVDFDRLRFSRHNLYIDGLELSIPDKGISVEFDSLRSEFSIRGRRAQMIALYRPQIVITPAKAGDEKPVSEDAESAEKSELPNIRIDSLFIDRAEFGTGGFSAEDFTYIGSMETKRGAIILVADSIGAFLPGRGRVNCAKGSIVYDDGIALDLLLTLNRTNLDVEGAITNFDPVEWHFKGGGETVDLVEVDSLLGLDVLVGNGNLEIDLGGRGDSVSGNIFLNGEIFDIPAGNVRTDLVFANQRLVLANLCGEAWGASVDADIQLDFTKNKSGGSIGLSIHGSAENLDLNAFMVDSGLPSRLTGETRIEGTILDESVMLSIFGDLDAGEILGFPFDEVTGSLFVSPDSVRFYPGFEVLTGGNFLTFTGVIVMDGEIFIEFGLWARDVAKIASWFGIEDVVGGRLRLENGEILGTVDNPILSLDIMSDSLVTAFLQHDRLVGDVTMYDLATFPHGDIYIVTGGSIAGLGFDSLMTNVEIHGNRFYVKPLRIWGDTLSVKGIAEIYIDEDSIGIQAEGLELIFLGKPVVLESTFTVSILGENIEASPLLASALGGNLVVEDFRGDRDGISLKASFKDLRYGELGDIVGSRDIYGRINGSLFYSTSSDVEGGTGTFSLAIDDLVTGDLRWEKAEAEGAIHGGVLKIEPFVVSRKTEKYTMNGWVDLSADDKPFSVEVGGSGDRIDALHAFLVEVDSAVGPYDLTLFVAGNRDFIFADGRFEWNNGVLVMRDLADPIESLCVRMTLDGEKLYVDSLSGVIGALPIDSKSIWARVKRLFTRRKKEYGNFELEGLIDFFEPTSPKPDIRLHLERLPLNFPDDGIFTRLGADLNLSFDRKMKISGNVNVDYANIVQLETGGNGGTGEIPFDLNIVIDMPRNVYINTNLLETELGGKINILTENERLALYGDIDVLRGKVFFYGQTFKIEQGDIDFRTLEGINPTIDIRAVSRVEQIRVVIHITGDLDVPEIELYAEDQNGERLPFDQRQILSVLAFRTGGDGSDTTGFEVGSVIEERLPQVIQSYISREMETMARKTLGVETFEFEPSDEDVFDFSQANVTIGKYLTDKLYLKYTRSLSFDETAEDIINLQYRITDHIFIEGTREAGQKDKDSYRLDLKFRWEY